MALVSRLTVLESKEPEPEDIMCAALAVIFPDDVMVQHGDPDHALEWRSPHLPPGKHLRITLADPPDRHDRYLFSHYLWNASLLVAEFVEAASLGVPLGMPSGVGRGSSSPRGKMIPGPPAASPRIGAEDEDEEEEEVDLSVFSVRGKRVLEVGAGTALPSMVASLVGASRVAATDYPSPIVLETLAANVAANASAENSPLHPPRVVPIEVYGHKWGDLPTSSPVFEDAEADEDDEEEENGSASAAASREWKRQQRERDQAFATANAGAFDVVLSCDCLWMPWQHAGLRRSISHFLAPGPGARALVAAGFHTGRGELRGFFDSEALARLGLEVERIWERDCHGAERPWSLDRGLEDVTERKRWLVVAVLRRIRST